MRIRFRTGAVLAVGVLALGGLAACGASGDGGGSASPSGSSYVPLPTEPAPVTSAPVTVPPQTDKPGVDPTKGEAVTLTGTIEAGVESGCLVLRTEGKVYSLFGGDPSLMVAGKRVEVTGHESPDVMSFCQQGVPFQVESARAL